MARLFACVGALTLPGAGLQAQQNDDGPPKLLTGTAMPTQGFEAKPYIARAEPVLVDRDLLSILSPGNEIELNLFPDVSFKGQVTRVTKRSPACYTVKGTLEGVEHSSFTIVVNDEVAVGLIEAQMAGGRYKLRYLADGVHLITELDDSGFGGCGLEDSPAQGKKPVGQSPPKPDSEEEPLDGDGGGMRGACSEPTAKFDLIIFYTTKAKNAAGGKNAIEAECILAEEGMNDSYDNSQISARGRLLHVKEVSYDESGDLEDHRDRIQDPDDGVLDNIPQARDSFTADLVSLWVNDTDNGDTCGIAFCTPGEDEAYQITNWDCAVGSYTFQHEHGHLQGCAHNEEDSGYGCAWYDYSYGWRWFGDSGKGWRSVMAYNNDDKDYTRINWFSNPNIGYDGEPTGVAEEADNARTINNRRRYVEDFRHSKFDVWVDFDLDGFESGTFENPYDTVAEGVNRAYGGSDALLTPTVHIKAGQTNETPTINKHVIITSCGGTARIGG
jgi:hypothetical protein